MGCDIEEKVLILRCRIFWAMRSWIGKDHHNGPVRLALFCSSKKGQRVVCNDIWEIILGIVPTVPDLVRDSPFKKGWDTVDNCSGYSFTVGKSLPLCLYHNHWLVYNYLQK